MTRMMAVALTTSAAAHRHILERCIVHGASMMLESVRDVFGFPCLSTQRFWL